MNIAALNQKYGIADILEFSTGKGNLPVASITNKFATSVISLYGAHVLSYQPSGQENVLWMSDQSVYEVGKPIRGGIPVCFPWFGPHATDSQKAVHGFARLLTWDVKRTGSSEDGSTVLVLELIESPETMAIWPYSFKAELTVTVGAKLTVTLRFMNDGTDSFTCTDALHSYFNVSDLEDISISGLLNSPYTVAGSTDTLIQEEDLLTIKKEENRRYTNHTGDCIISDEKFARKINVSKTGSNVTVVWNPFAETAKNIGDMPDDGYKKFVCVEAVNAFSDAITLAPNEEWSITADISVN